jgi:RimJ/RimL family protein N-acetyltransferase
VTDELELSLLVAADAGDLAELLDDPVLREWLRSSKVDELRERFRGWETRRSPDGAEEWLNWVARRRSDGAAVTWMQAKVRGATGEIAYATVPSQRRRGYTVAAARVVVGWMPGLGVATIEAHIDPANAASEAVARSLGFARSDRVAGGEAVWVRAASGAG